MTIPLIGRLPTRVSAASNADVEFLEGGLDQVQGANVDVSAWRVIWLRCGPASAREVPDVGDSVQPSR